MVYGKFQLQYVPTIFPIVFPNYFFFHNVPNFIIILRRKFNFKTFGYLSSRYLWCLKALSFVSHKLLTKSDLRHLTEYTTAGKTISCVRKTINNPVSSIIYLTVSHIYLTFCIVTL